MLDVVCLQANTITGRSRFLVTDSADLLLCTSTLFMTSRRKLYGDRNAALDWLRQLQDRGATKSRFGAISEADAQKQLKEKPYILENLAIKLFGKKIDAQKEAFRLFPSNEKIIFHSYVKEISTRLNSLLKRKDGQPFTPPIVDVLQGPSLSPVHQRVLSTDTEIILIPVEFMFFSNLAARSIALVLNPRTTKDNWINVPSPSAVNLHESKAVRGLNFLSMVIHCHIAHGESYLVPLPPIGKRHEPLRTWILDAIETFAIAHEYGHFVAGHSDEPVNGESRLEGITPHIAMELEADLIGQHLSMLIGSRMKNPLLSHNIGAIILIHIGEYIRQARSILNGNKCAPASDTHPAPEERIMALQISSAEDFCEEIPEFVKIQQDHWNAFMNNVWLEIEPFFHECFRNMGPLNICSYET